MLLAAPEPTEGARKPAVHSVVVAVVVLAIVGTAAIGHRSVVAVAAVAATPGIVDTAETVDTVADPASRLEPNSWWSERQIPQGWTCCCFVQAPLQSFVVLWQRKESRFLVSNDRQRSNRLFSR